jgi:hypothetical protein
MDISSRWFGSSVTNGRTLVKGEARTLVLKRLYMDI